MKKILVVDDDPDILDAIHMILDTGGYESTSITQGEQTFKLVNDYKPDLIILDILLSGSDGRKICLALKTDARTKDIPIIMISAHPGARASTQESGAESFIAKPFSVTQLLEEVEKYLK